MSDIYTPEGASSLDKDTSNPQIRLGLQGYPGTGKTWSALTFPNCVVANFDKGLVAHRGRKDVVQVPFWDGAYCDSIIQRDGQEAPPNRRDAFLVFLAREASKLVTEQTLVIDSNRQIEMAFHTQYKLNPVLTKKGKEDGFEEFFQKINYFQRLGTLYKELNCDLVYLCHEVDDVDDEGNINGKVKVALTGQSGRTIASDFTDWFRQIAIAKPASSDQRQALIDSKYNPGKDIDSWLEMNSTNTIYLWQTQSDEICKCKTSLVNAPKYIIANCDTFTKYKRKVE